MSQAARSLQNRYQIVRVLGQGGKGCVYLCNDTRLSGKQWAVKEMVCPENLPYGARESFEREVRILSGLRHRNLPMIVDYFHEDGNEYLVMEYVDGRTLFEEIQTRGPADETQALRWGLEVARLLDYLHTREPPVIFRDLKPENIMVLENRALKLIDFGLARHFDPGKRRDTHSSGSVGYAPPEQWEDEGQTDARADLYALGATLFYVLTGRAPSPVYGSNQLRTHRSDLDPELEALVQRCLEADPDRRFPTAARAVHELFLLLSRKLPSGELPPPAPAPRSQTRRGKGVRPRVARSGPVPRRAVGPEPSPRERRPSWLSWLLRLSTLVFVLGAVAGLALPASIRPRVSVCDQASALAAGGQYHRAIALLDDQLTRHPADAEALILKQNLYAELTGREVLRVPVITSLTGLDSEGYPVLYGVALAQKEINDFGGIRQHPLVVEVFDDESNSDRALGIAQKLAARPDVLVTLGPFSSQRALAIYPVFDAAHLTLLAPSASDPRLWESSPYLLTAADSNENRIRALARFFYSRGYRRGGLLVDESLILSHSFAQIFLSAFEEMGGQVVGSLSYQSDTEDFGPMVSTMAERKPEFLFLCDYRTVRLLELEQAMAKVGWKLPVGCQVALFAPGLEPYEQIYTSSFFHPEASDPAVRKFVEEYRQTFGLDASVSLPSHVASGAYDSMKVVAEALKEAGDSRESVNRYLTSIGGSRPPYRGVTGRFGLGHKLELRDVFIIEIDHGQYLLRSEVPSDR